MKLGLNLIAVFSAVLFASGVSAREPVIPDVDYYDCSGKPNGHEVHPWDCTRFIHCDNGRAHDKSCAACHVDAVTCPEGWLVFDYRQQQCEWANMTDADCSASSTDDETDITTDGTPEEDTTTTNPPIETTITDDRIPCDPRNCTHTGHCQTFNKCGDDGFLETVTCPRDSDGKALWWNPERNGEHGGVCDLWGGLSNDLQESYLNDHSCITPCKYELESPCSGNYTYHDGLPNGNSFKLTCSSGLLFNQDAETCDFCYNVAGNNDQKCC